MLGADLMREQTSSFAQTRSVLTYTRIARPVRSKSPRPKSAISIDSRSVGVSTMPAASSACAARSFTREVADSCSAWSVRAWPIASSRPSSSSASPRIASLRFSTSSRYESSRSSSMRSASSPRRTSITGTLQWYGSSRNSEPSLPTISTSSRFVIAVPQSKRASTSFGNRIVPVNTQSVPDGPNHASPCTRSGSPAIQRDHETL